MANIPPPVSEQDQARSRPNYPLNSLCGLPPELRAGLVDYLPLITQKQLRLVNTTLCQHATPRVFKRVVVPETAGRSTRRIPESLFANNTTSITILKREVGATNQTYTSSIPGSVQNAIEPFNDQKKPPPAFRTSFIQKLFTNAPLVDEVCIQHPVSLKNLQIILNILGTRLRSLSITGEAYSVTMRKKGGLQFLVTSATTKLEQLRLTPIRLPCTLDEAEEYAIATLVSRSSATLRCLDLGWAVPELARLPAALGDCRMLTTLNLNGYRQGCADILPSLLANNPSLKSLCLRNINLANEPADGNLARAFVAFEGTLSRLEITCVDSVPNWFYSANCLKSLSALAIQTKEVGDAFVGWIADLGKLRRIELTDAKFESDVDYTPCLPYTTALQFCNCEIPFNSLSQLVCSASALASLSFSKVHLVDSDDHTMFDVISTILDQPAVQIFGRKFATATTPPERNDITMRLALHSKNEVSDDQPVSFYLQQKWLASRSRSQEDLTDTQLTGLLSTDEEFGINSGSDQSANSSLDVDGLTSQSQVQGDSLAREEENSSSSTSSLISMSHDFVAGDDPLEPRQSPLQDISNKRDRITFSGTDSGDGERYDKRSRSDKRSCVGESKSVSPPSPSRRNALNRPPRTRARVWGDEENESEKIK